MYLICKSEWKEILKIGKRNRDPWWFIRGREKTHRPISPLCCARVCAQAVVSQFGFTTATQSALDVVASSSVRKSYRMSREQCRNNRRDRDSGHKEVLRGVFSFFFFLLRNKTTNKELWRSAMVAYSKFRTGSSERSSVFAVLVTQSNKRTIITKKKVFEQREALLGQPAAIN